MHSIKTNKDGHLEVLIGKSILLIDREDYDHIKKLRLYIKIQKMQRGHIYAVLYKREDKKTVYVNTLHSFIMGLGKEDNLVTDHINYDTLDCRKSNLRTTTDSLNKSRREKIRNKTGFLGVGVENNSYYFQIRHNGVRCRDELATALFGEMARRNDDAITKRTISESHNNEHISRPNRFGLGIILNKSGSFSGQVVKNGKKYFTRTFKSVTHAMVARDILSYELNGSDCDRNFKTILSIKKHGQETKSHGFFLEKQASNTLALLNFSKEIGLEMDILRATVFGNSKRRDFDNKCKEIGENQLNMQ